MASAVSAMPNSSTPVTPVRLSPLPRRSTLVRKREDEPSQFPSSPSKRSRVTFDSDVEVRSVDEYEKAPELIQEEVRSALEGKNVGDRSGYEKLKAVYAQKSIDDNEISPATLGNYTKALLRNVPALNKANRDLVQVVIKSEWLGRSEDYVSIFTKLLASILNANGTFLENTLVMLISNLTSRPPSSGHLPDESTVRKPKIYDRAHKALQYLLHLMPSASNTLRAVLSRAYPHSTDTVRAHLIITKNLLAVLDYAPELQTDILALITDRLVKIDIQVQIDIEDLEEDMDDGFLESLNHADPIAFEELAGDSDSSDDDSDPEEEDPEMQRMRQIRRNIEKTDSIMDILFNYYDSKYSSPKGGMGPATVVDYLISQFDATILPTQRSRHAQFLVFHFVQQSQGDIDQFVGVCASKVLDKKQPALLRQNAAAYLGSFVARGMKVPPSIVRMVFEYISQELHRLRREFEPTCRGPDLRRYSVYYCLVQVLLYMFCFRWRDLELRAEEDEDEEDDLNISYTQGHQWKVDVKAVFSPHVFSKLNPLKACSPAIVNEFARVAKYLGVVYVYHLLETNKRLRPPRRPVIISGVDHHGHPDRESALSMSQDESQFYLDAYFPFDPYHLPKSKRWITEDYREWTPIPGLDDEDADSESDEEEDGCAGNDLEDGMETDITGTSS